MQEQIPRSTRAELKDALRAAGERFLAFGITSVGEARIRTSDEFAAYQELAAAGELPVRVFTMMLIDDTLDALSRLGMRTGWGDAWLRIGPAKLFQDGSGGGRTAAMTTDYVNDPGNRGITIYDQEGLNERFGARPRRGVPAGRARHRRPRHHHDPRRLRAGADARRRKPTTASASSTAGCARPEIIDRMARMQIIAVPQPSVHF